LRDDGKRAPGASVPSRTALRTRWYTWRKRGVESRRSTRTKDALGRDFIAQWPSQHFTFWPSGKAKSIIHLWNRRIQAAWLSNSRCRRGFAGGQHEIQWHREEIQWHPDSCSDDLRPGPFSIVGNIDGIRCVLSCLHCAQTAGGRRTS